MKFCPVCNSMMKKVGNKYVCVSCGYEIKANPEKEERSNSSRIVFRASDRDLVIVDTGGANLPVTTIKCPKCGNNEAYYIVRQTRSADEPETVIYICTKCRYTWREY